MKKINTYLIITGLLLSQNGCMRMIAEKYIDCPLGYSGNCFAANKNDAAFDIVVPIDAPPACKELGKVYYKAWANNWQGERKRGTLNNDSHQDLVPLSGGMLYPAFALVSGLSAWYESERKDIKISAVKKMYEEKGCPPMITRAELQKQLEKKYAELSTQNEK